MTIMAMCTFTGRYTSIPTNKLCDALFDKLNVEAYNATYWTRRLSQNIMCFPAVQINLYLRDIKSQKQTKAQSLPTQHKQN